MYPKGNLGIAPSEFQKEKAGHFLQLIFVVFKDLLISIG